MNFVASCLLSGGIEIVYQVAVEQRHFGCIDWTSVLWETVTGCVKLPKWAKPFKGGGGCGKNSFPADTLVHTEQGLKPIQDIQVGDKVFALDERTQQTSYQPVLQLIQNQGHYQFIKVTLENGEQLEATAEHPFYIQGKGWNAAVNLKVGDALLLHNGTTLVVKTLDTSVRVDAVYNFTVANLHNYFVGKDGVVAHNCSVPKQPTPPLKKPSDKWLKENGVDPHKVKGDGGSRFDIYVDKNGDMWLLPKNTRGAEPEYVGNIKD